MSISASDLCEFQSSIRPLPMPKAFRCSPLPVRTLAHAFLLLRRITEMQVPDRQESVQLRRRMLPPCS